MILAKFIGPSNDSHRVWSPAMSGEVTLTGWIEIPAPERAAILPLLAEHVRLTREEPGCLGLHRYRDRRPS
jgi:hypothetical protein